MKRPVSWLWIVLLAPVVTVTLGWGSFGDDLSVLGKGSNLILHYYLMLEARTQFEARRADVEKALVSSETAEARISDLKHKYQLLLGVLPERTPLNARVSGTIEGDGYRIEKVVFESRPGHHVTGNLYVPAGPPSPPRPGVLVLCGHSNLGKAHEPYQLASILLCRSGMVTLIVDPICQGERFQLLDDKGRPLTRGGTTAHTLLDVGANLVGTDVTAYELWDNVRALDYLASRPEVDPKRLGVTGNSGGGTQTAYLMAFDPRVAVAAPSCFITSQEKLFKTIGPQDGCQNLPGEGIMGIEHADFITMRAPLPTIILAAERDYFDIEGTRSTFAEAGRFYAALGFPERLDLFTFDDPHGFSRPRREAAASWMRRWLLDDPTPVVEPALTVRKEKELWATPTGQVGSSFEGEVTVADLNLDLAKSLGMAREDFWKDNPKADCIAEVKKIAGIRDVTGRPEVVPFGTVTRRGYRIEKLLIRRTGEVPLPSLLFIPEAASGKLPAVLYVDGRGKGFEARRKGEIPRLVREGNIVLSIDVRGFGETADDRKAKSNDRKYMNSEHRNARLADHIGRPLLGQRVEDVIVALEVLLSRDDVDPGKVRLVGVGRAGPVALHAAAIDTRFTSVTLQGSIFSWVDTVASPLAPEQMTHVVPGALIFYDLPDLVRAVEPRPVIIIDPVDPFGNPDGDAPKP